jgi:hypothetical protein
MPPDYTERASGIILKVNENYSVRMKLRGCGGGTPGQGTGPTVRERPVRGPGQQCERARSGDRANSKEASGRGTGLNAL